MTSGHAPTGMIADYAAGALSEGMSLLVASHLACCSCCHDKAARLEALGGALLADGDPVPPGPRCLERALARIEAPADAAAAPAPAEPSLPRPLCRRLAARMCDLHWQPLAPGLSACWLDGFVSERVGLLRARPGVRVEPHGHAGPEATLVLAGSMRDRERTYHRGELAFADEAVEHAPQAVGAEACLCLVVLSPEPR